MSKSFLTELRHRKVIKTTLGYVVLVAAVVEFTSMMIPAFSLPESLMRNMIVFGLMGVPIVIVLSWFFDLTSAGVILGTSSAKDTKVNSRDHSQFVSLLLIALLASTVLYLSYRLYWESHEKSEFDRGKSIAVMPFSSISAINEPDTAYFSRGVSEEILNALSKVEGLRVAARTSSFSFKQFDVKEVGKALNVSVLLLGSVRRENDQLRISAQLVDTKSGFQLWSDVYDHKVDDVFEIQEKIAHAIVKSLQIKLLGDSTTKLISPGTISLKAYDKYLAGRDVLKNRTSANARKAIDIFQQALDIDPNYAQAYAGLADSWILLREVGNIPLFKATQNSHDAITKSLQLNNTLPEAQASLGLCVLGGESFNLAARQFQKAIDLDPEYSNGYFLRANLLRDRGNLAESTRVYTQAIALDPLNLTIIENQALLFAYQGRYPKAIEQLKAVANNNPGRLSNSLFLSKVYALAGDNLNALVHAEVAVELEPKSPITLSILLDSYVRLANIKQANLVYQTILKEASNNETAIIAMMNFHLMTGDYDELDKVTSNRLVGFIDNDGFKQTQILFKRVGWAARAHLVLGNHKAAREVLEKGIPDLIKIVPQPESIQILTLLVRAKFLDGDIQGAQESANNVVQLINQAQSEGMNTTQLEYARTCLAASTNQSEQAISHLKNAVSSGWNNFVLSTHDPMMIDVVKLDEYKSMLETKKTQQHKLLGK